MTRTLPTLTLLAALLPAAVSATPVAIVNAGFEALYFGSNLPAVHGGDVPAGAFPVGPPPAGWSLYDPGGEVSGGPSFVGVLNPGTLAADGATFFPGGAPEGDNAVLLYTDGVVGGAAYGVSQILAETLSAGTTYTLSVEVGNIASGTGIPDPYAGFGPYNLDGFPGYAVQLLAGGVLLAEDASTLLPAEGTFELSTVSFTALPGHAQLGQQLEIRLLNLNDPDAALTGSPDPGTKGLEVDFDDVRLAATVDAPASGGLLILGAALAGFLRRRR